MSAFQIFKSANRKRNIIVTISMIAFVLLVIAGSCNNKSNPTADKLNNGECGSVDTVKSFTTGEISAYISNQQDNVDYFLEVASDNSSSLQKIKGIRNAGSPYVFFTGVPSGTHQCDWIVSGCPDDGEHIIPGPSTVTAK